MFTEMVNTIKKGKMPNLVLLAGRFHAGLTKKLAVVKLPPAFWTADPKINPPSDHLLWASLLLEDRDGYDMVLSVIATEIAEKTNSSDIEKALTQKTEEILATLYTTAPTQILRNILLGKAQKLNRSVTGSV